MVTEKGLTWGSEHVQHADDVLQNCTPESYIILLNNAMPVNSIKKEGKAMSLSHSPAHRAGWTSFVSHKDITDLSGHCSMGNAEAGPGPQL